MVTKIVKSIILVVFILFPTQVNSRENSNKSDSIEMNLDTQRVVWMSGEYGTHSRDLSGIYITSGVYEKISLELPFGRNVGLFVLFDALKYESFHKNFGIGVYFTLLNVGYLDFIGTPSLYGGDYIGLMLPVTMAYGILDDKLRLQITVSYRGEGDLSISGHNSLSFYTVSLGVGMALSKILPKNESNKINF